ncbi:hypothetical protein ACLX1H_006564 [Fusarium chlamydosporum]
MPSISVPRVTVTAVTGETVPISITDTFWPDFKQEVEMDKCDIRPHELDCPICLEQMISSPEQVQDVQIDGLAVFTDVCHDPLPRHECGHQPLGLLAPSEKSSFSRIPPVTTQGGLAATNCGFCEGKLALEQLHAVAATDPPKLKRKECMNLSIKAKPSSQDIVKKGKGYEVVDRDDNEAKFQRKIECEDVPTIVSNLWEAYVESWERQATQLWFHVDPSLFLLHASVGKKLKVKEESVGFFDRFRG